MPTNRNSLWLTYLIEAPAEKLIIPKPAKPRRTDGLWQTTCLEMFVAGDGESYSEFNFSPSGEWAAYGFAEYRGTPEPTYFDKPPEAHFHDERHYWMLSAGVHWAVPAGARIGLSAVIEETDGTKSYWALRHPPGRPDFHHPDCFALTLGAPPPA